MPECGPEQSESPFHYVFARVFSGPDTITRAITTSSFRFIEQGLIDGSSTILPMAITLWSPRSRGIHHQINQFRTRKVDFPKWRLRSLRRL